MFAHTQPEKGGSDHVLAFRGFDKASYITTVCVCVGGWLAGWLGE